MAQTSNIASILDNAAARWPSATALHHRDTALDYTTLRLHVDAFASALAEDGAGPGTCVAMLAPNSPEFVCAYFGILKTGATLLPVNPLMLPKSVAEQMQLCKATTLFVHPALDSAALREALVGFNVTTLALPSVSGDARFEAVYLGPESVAVRLFTSGTTGAAKAIGLSHYNLLLNALLVRDMLQCQQGDRILASVPLAYGIGQTGLLNAPIMAGAAVVLQSAFHPSEAIELIRKHRVTAMIGVPTLYRKLLDAATVAGAPSAPLFTEHWRLACIGGAPVPASLWEEIERVFGPKVFVGYGLSETSPMICSTLPGTPPTPHLIGKPPIGVDLSVRTPAGHPVREGESGELWTRGHAIGLQYLVSEGEPAPTAFEGTWFKTGDVARMDEHGDFFLLGRIKDVIMRSAHNINPAEIEQVLAQHPAVAMVAVLGVPDAVVGEEIAACIVPFPGHDDHEGLASQITAWVRERLPVHAYPRHVRILDALPMGPTGKVLKTELRKLFTSSTD